MKAAGFLRSLAVLLVLSVGVGVPGVRADQESREPDVRRIVSSKSAAALAAMQMRTFNMTDRSALLRGLVVNLLSQGYIIDAVDPEAGTVRANKGSLLRVVAFVTPDGSDRTAVLFDAYFFASEKNGEMRQVDDPAFYQDHLFKPLSAALGLPALPVT